MNEIFKKGLGGWVLMKCVWFEVGRSNGGRKWLIRGLDCGYRGGVYGNDGDLEVCCESKCRGGNNDPACSYTTTC